VFANKTPEQLEQRVQPSPCVEILRRYEGVDPSLVHLDVGETSALTGQSPKTLESWRNQGQELPFLKLGRRVRYQLSDVLSFLDRNTYSSTREAKTRDRSAPPTTRGRT
jgi:hypothetical protein